MLNGMNQMLAGLLEQLRLRQATENMGAAYRPGDPTIATRHNLQEIRRAGCEMASLVIAETESFDFPDGTRSTPDRSTLADAVGASLYKDLKDFAATIAPESTAESRGMNYAEVREELSGYFTMLAHAVTEEGRNEYLAKVGAFSRGQVKQPEIEEKCCGPIRGMGLAVANGTFPADPQAPALLKYPTDAELVI